MTKKYINETTYNQFNKNKAIIRDYYEGVYYCYLINTQGELLHKFEPDIWVNDIEDDNVIVASDSDFNGTALFDFNGKQLTNFVYKVIYGGVEEGFFEVRNLNNKAGQLSMQGVEIIPCIYEDSRYFHEGIASMKLDDKWGCVDCNNNTVIPFIYEDLGICYDNKICAKKENKWGVIDKFNNKLIEFKFDDINLYINRDDGSFPVKINDKWGIIDIYGETIYDFNYDDCENLDEKGWFKFQKDNKWAIYSSEKNEFISDFIYEDVEYYSDGLCLVKLNGKSDYVDKFNVPVSDFYYDSIKHFYRTNLIAIYKSGKCGLMNTNGKILIPPKYKDGIRNASENMLVMEDDNCTQYVVDIEENVVIPKKEYQRFYGGYSCGYIVSRLNDGYYDKKGQKLELKFNLKNNCL